MRTLLCLLICALVLTGAGRAQQSFITSFGGPARDQLMHPIVRTPEGGYCVAGITKSFGAGLEDILLVSTDASGVLQWARTCGGSSVDFCHSLAASLDGGYVMAGWTNSFGGTFDAFLLKVASTGSFEWMRTYGLGSSDDYAFSVVAASDGGYALLGYTSTGGNDILLIKTDGAGSPQWARSYGLSTVDDRGKLLIRSADDGYVLVSRAASFSAGGKDFLLMKTDSTGTLEWTRTYGGAADDAVYDVIATSDGGYAACGRTRSFGMGDWDALVLKLAADGALQWARTYGETAFDDFSNSIVETRDGGYATSGHTRSFGAGLDECSLMRIGPSGELLWARAFGGVQMDENLTLLQTEDGGFVLNGFTASYGAGERDGVLMRTTEDGGIFGCPGEVAPTMGTPSLIISSPVMPSAEVLPVTGAPTPELSSPVLSTTVVCDLWVSDAAPPSASGITLKVYPNPFHEAVELRLPRIGCEIQVRDVLGRLVYRKNVISNQETLRLDLPSGIYFYRVMEGERCAGMGKLVAR